MWLRLQGGNIFISGDRAAQETRAPGWRASSLPLLVLNMPPKLWRELGYPLWRGATVL